jgi:hypothetical protein
MIKSAVHQRLSNRGFKLSPYDLTGPITKAQQISQNKRPLELQPQPERRMKFQKQQSDD